MSVRIGTSGWVYSDWRDIWYPKELRRDEWFAFYAQRFDSVEINNSFYRLPSAATFDTWRAQAPPGFLYAVKASRFLTHLKKLKDPEGPLQLFFDRALHLGPTLGPVLYQLPPHWKLNLARLDGFLEALPGGHIHVVEFRDASWLVEEAFRALERYGVVHCIHDMPPLDVPLRVTASSIYVRLHGGAAYSGFYSYQTLHMWAKRIEEWCRQKLDVFVYFNNDVQGHAVQNAALLRELVG